MRGDRRDAEPLDELAEALRRAERYITTRELEKARQLVRLALALHRERKADA